MSFEQTAVALRALNFVFVRSKWMRSRMAARSVDTLTYSRCDARHSAPEKRNVDTSYCECVCDARCRGLGEFLNSFIPFSLRRQSERTKWKNRIFEFLLVRRWRERALSAPFQPINKWQTKRLPKIQFGRLIEKLHYILSKRTQTQVRNFAKMLAAIVSVRQPVLSDSAKRVNYA